MRGKPPLAVSPACTQSLILFVLKDRIVWTSGCVVHDFRHANGKVADGCHGTALAHDHTYDAALLKIVCLSDYSAVKCIPLRVAAVYNQTCVTLKPFGLYEAVTRCLNPDGSLFLDWNDNKVTLVKTNNIHGIEECDAH